MYDCEETDFTTPSAFYDYDISSGQNADGRWRTGITGINSESNYGTSRNGQTTWKSYRDVLAFGNANCGTGMANYKFDDVYLNKNNTSTGSGGTFGLASSLSDGKIVYNEWIVAPKLFNDGFANGKHPYENSSLTFRKVGDTYTLSAASVNGVGSIDGLQDFFHPSPDTRVYENILTNDFWPLDNATDRTDPNIGGATIGYQGFASVDGISGTWSGEALNFPPSDDGNAHNCFFGMQYAVTFTLSEDYIGPLEYYFFGDDDMWVFLDDKLVCDIGGVHISMGEYVNLWDYLEKGKAGEHTLTFFYTERGASGSTCHMNFTLPSVSGVNIEQKTAQLRVEKKVLGEADPNKEFNFRIQFFDSNGNPVLDDYAYTRYNADGTPQGGNLIVRDGDEFNLRAGEYILIDYLPYGLRYTITETVDAGYTVTNTVNGVLHDGAAASGTVIIDAANTVTFTNTRNTVGFQLQKLDPDKEPLSGAEFTLADSSGSLVNAVKNEDGSYTVPASATEQVVDKGEYYIAAAADQSYVLAQDIGSAKYDAKLQKKTGAASQQFRVYRQSDGSYSFLCLGSTNGKNMWLDLDGGKLENGTLVHFWDNDYTPTDHDNQKWFLVMNDDGSLTFKPRVAVLNKSNAVMDINTGILQEDQKIQLWEGNNTNAQKWVLVPVNSTAAPSTTQTFQVNAQGMLSITGLLPGTYTLTEKTVPSGCIGLDGPVTIHVDAAGKVTVSGSPLVTADGNNVVRMTNQYQPRELTLEKKVQNSDTTEAFSFTELHGKWGIACRADGFPVQRAEYRTAVHPLQRPGDHLGGRTQGFRAVLQERGEHSSDRGRRLLHVHHEG